GLTEPSVGRHKKAHVDPGLKAVRTEQRAKRARKAATSALVETDALIADAKQRLDSTINSVMAMTIHRELRGHLTLLAKLDGSLDERPQTTVNINTSPDWIKIRTVMLQTLMKFPDACRAVSDELAKLDTA